MKSNTWLKIIVAILVPLLVVSLYYNAVVLSNRDYNAIPYQTVTTSKNDVIVSGMGIDSLGSLGRDLDLPENTLVVSGSSTVYAEPNITVISVRIATETPMKTASDAYNYVVSKASKLVGELKNMTSVIELKTVNIGLQPIYDYSGGSRIFRGYNAYYQLMVTTTVDEAGKIIATIVEKGGNVIESISLTYPRQVVSRAYELALKKALDNAREKADIIAEKLGIKIIGVRAVSLVSLQNYQQVQYSRTYYEAATVSSSLPPAPIETGEQPVATANVIVVFNIANP